MNVKKNLMFYNPEYHVNANMCLANLLKCYFIYVLVEVKQRDEKKSSNWFSSQIRKLVVDLLQFNFGIYKQKNKFLKFLSWKFQLVLFHYILHKGAINEINNRSNKQHRWVDRN